MLGEFVCPEVLEIKNFEEAEKKSRVPAHDIHNYAAGSRNKVYGWEVADVKEYPQAVALEELGIEACAAVVAVCEVRTWTRYNMTKSKKTGKDKSPCRTWRRRRERKPQCVCMRN